jgi:hypothetical protein
MTGQSAESRKQNHYESIGGPSQLASFNSSSKINHHNVYSHNSSQKFNHRISDNTAKFNSIQIQQVDSNTDKDRLIDIKTGSKEFKKGKMKEALS